MQPGIANGSGEKNAALGSVEGTSMAIVVVGGNTYLFATSGADGVGVFTVNRDGSLADVAHITADATVRLIAPNQPPVVLDHDTRLLIQIMDYIVQNAIADPALMQSPTQY